MYNSDKLVLKYYENIKVIPIKDFIEIINNKYNQKYIYQSNVKIVYEDKEVFSDILSIFNDIEKICFYNPNTNVDYVIKLKNMNRYSILTGEILEYPLVIIFDTLPENSDLILSDSIKLYDNERINYFYVKKEEYIELNLNDFVINDSKILQNIKYLVDFSPDLILNLTKYPYTLKTIDNNIIKIQILTEDKILDTLDKSFKENNLKIKSSYLLFIDGYNFIRTSKNNLIILDTKNKKQL